MFAFWMYAHVLHLSGKPCVLYWQYHYIHFVQYVYAMIFNCNLLVNGIELVTCWRIRRTRTWEQLLSMRKGFIQCIDKLIHVYKDIVFGILQLICVIPCNSGYNDCRNAFVISWRPRDTRWTMECFVSNAMTICFSCNIWQSNEIANRHHN